MRVHFIIGRADGATPNPTARRSKQTVARHRPHLDRRARRGAGAAHDPPARRARCSRAIATRSPTAIARPIRRAIAVADIRVIESLSPERPLGVDFYHRRRGRAARVGLKVWSHRPADPAVRARAGAREHGLPGGRRADLSHRADERRAEPGVWLHDMMLERADGGADRSRRRSRRGSKPASSW